MLNIKILLLTKTKKNSYNMKKITQKRIEFEASLIEMANNVLSGTKENILDLFNKEYNKNLVELNENEFAILSGRIGKILAQETSGKRDAISEFTMKDQFREIDVYIIKEFGFNFALYIYLMCKLGNLKLVC